MASIQEKLADSLSVLKKYQDENNSDIIQGIKTLGETHTKRLIDNGYDPNSSPEEDPVNCDAYDDE